MEGESVEGVLLEVKSVYTGDIEGALREIVEELRNLVAAVKALDDTAEDISASVGALT